MTPQEAEDQDTWRRAIALRMDVFERQLEANTEATTRVETNTNELVDLLKSFKGAMKVLELVGKLAKPLAAVAALVGTVYALWRRG